MIDDDLFDISVNDNNDYFANLSTKTYDNINFPTKPEMSVMPEYGFKLGKIDHDEMGSVWNSLNMRNPRVFDLKNLCSLLTHVNLNLVNNAYLLSKLRYMCPIWGTATKANKKQIYNILRRSGRFVLNLQKYDKVIHVLYIVFCKQSL
jgi:hypothetical protein